MAINEKRIQGLKVYSLRHGLAWKAHKESENPLKVRDASVFMGHDPQTHLKHYSRWVDEAGLEEVDAKFKKSQLAAICK